jgi:hypothetical protein
LSDAGNDEPTPEEFRDFVLAETPDLLGQVDRACNLFALKV